MGHAPQLEMFTIEFVRMKPGQQPDVVERMATGATLLLDAEWVAHSLLDGVRRRQRAAPPDGYQILKNGFVVSRSWKPAL
jgi:hypothetical protein